MFTCVMPDSVMLYLKRCLSWAVAYDFDDFDFFSTFIRSGLIAIYYLRDFTIYFLHLATK